MEITARPRRNPSSHRVLVRVVLALLVLVATALLAPAALGLQRHVVADGGADGTYATGWMIFDELVPVEELRIGDLVTFAPPTTDRAQRVTRRIVEIHDDQLVTRGDALAEADPWLVQVDRSGAARVAFAVPWVGYPWLLVDAVGPGGWAFVALAMVMAGLVVLRSRWRGARGPAGRSSGTAPRTASSPPGEPAALG